jgi:hypothetical protein
MDEWKMMFHVVFNHVPSECSEHGDVKVHKKEIERLRIMSLQGLSARACSGRGNSKSLEKNFSEGMIGFTFR